MNNGDRDKIWNHIGTINKEMGGVKEHVAVLTTDMGWIKKFQWMILGTSMTALVMIIMKTITGG